MGEHSGQAKSKVSSGKIEHTPSNGRELKRSLGLFAAFSVGVGTMAGAGIFVFPGMAVGAAGPAALISFGIGAVVALLVAMPAAELATEMPRSGGAYFFASRSLGTGWGVLAGVSQALGLVFAAAFYLVGAGRYLSETLSTLGWKENLSGPWPSFTIAVILIALAIISTRHSGRFQNLVLLPLLMILLSILGFGAFSLSGATSVTPREPGPWLPFGHLPVFTTSALVFTSYLGFAQIAAVAGDIRRPERNIPLAMVGSVLFVGFLYCATVYIGPRFLPPTRMGELGEDAMVELGRTLAGPLGGTAILAGGLLATISSANASILSSSRTVFALGADGLIPKRVSQVNERFHTPHLALLVAGVPIAGLTLVGRLDLLAQVASLLHLVLYSLTCFSLIALRRRGLDSYAPSFRCPGYPFVPLLGGLASLALMAFMSPVALIIGGSILLTALTWYRVGLTDTRLKREGENE